MYKIPVELSNLFFNQLPPMANLTVIFTLLFSLFVLSQASFQLTAQPENLVAESTPSNNKESANEPNLPFREISESDFMKVFDMPISKNTETLGRIGTVRPFTIMYEIRLHPINRHFQDNNNNINLNDPFMYKFQHHRHRCHHHHRNEKSVGPLEIPYGNDMIMGQDSNKVNGVELTEEHGKYLEKDGGFFNKARKFLGQF